MDFKHFMDQDQSEDYELKPLAGQVIRKKVDSIKIYFH